MRSKSKPNRVRHQPLQIYLSDDEADALRELVKQSGLSRSDVVRQLIRNANVVNPSDLH